MASAAISIRPLLKQDGELYKVHRLEALQQHPEAFAASYEEEKSQSVQSFEERLSSSNAITFGAFAGDVLTGSVTLFQDSKVKMQHKAYLFAMYVSEAHRGKGIAKTLISEAIKKARECADIEQLYLTVMSENHSAKRLYESYGFKTYGVEKNALKVDGAYYDEDHMMLILRH
ncbi:GNAT family N-acetyltransferase [Cytobacillus gottheilii]|uniref:GNAT family N-acetyltransferase n=1 Tax=Cytobacillus gottheilii TaxID=859144 RepID=A0ABX8FE46_9BACI|nr:GNAT family N-acetyltransferase [Cytobacillus gottheilii]QVY62285.1 GNAT family N-acetyltransferase [Cytobacillus gottheilii]